MRKIPPYFFLTKNTFIIAALIILSVPVFMACSSSEDGPAIKNSTENSSGTGGSMARFTVYGNYLYAVDLTGLNVYKLTNPEKPEFLKKITLSFDIETLFPYGDKLFVGSSGAIYIFDLKDPEQPELLSRTQHIELGCDPVVVQNNFAYATLRVGNACGRPVSVSALEIYDITDLSNPVLKRRLQVEEPYGLGLDNNILFVCNGNRGFTVYDISNPISPVLLKKYISPSAYDVIPLKGEKRLLLTGDDGFFQFDYTDPMNMVELSKISIQKNK